MTSQPKAPLVLKPATVSILKPANMPEFPILAPRPTMIQSDTAKGDEPEPELAVVPETEGTAGGGGVATSKAITDKEKPL